MDEIVQDIENILKGIHEEYTCFEEWLEAQANIVVFSDINRRYLGAGIRVNTFGAITLNTRDATLSAVGTPEWRPVNDVAVSIIDSIIKEIWNAS